MKYLYDNLSDKISNLTTKEYSTSFSFSTKLLNKNIRPAIYAIYGLVRFADEIVDTFEDCDKEKLLNSFIKDYNEAIKNKFSMNPILHSFQKYYYEYDFEPYQIESFFKSMKMDLNKKKYNEKSYKQYIHGSAEVVGLMCLKVFVKGNNELYQNLKESAIKLGSAFQKVNFLRDLNHDKVKLGRIYFPNIKNFKSMTENDKINIIKDIENDFNQAFIGLKKLDKDSILGVYVAFRYYIELLNKIKKTNLSTLKKKRIRINNFQKFIVIIYSKIKIDLGFI